MFTIRTSIEILYLKGINFRRNLISGIIFFLKFRGNLGNLISRTVLWELIFLVKTAKSAKI